MKPGDVVTCTCCGARAVATWSSAERAWQEGWPLALTWLHGPHPRTEVTHVAPERCLWCHERQAALPGAEPLYRPAPGAPAPVPPPAPAAEERPVEPYAPPVPCPSCHAAAGEPCRTGTGKVRTAPHLPRQDEELDARERGRARRAEARAGQLDMFGGAR